jgi:hypothetical protein
MNTFTAIALFAALLAASPAFAAEQSPPSTVSPRGTEGPDTRHVPPLPQHDTEWPAQR